MKRKIIKQGLGGYTIYLPKEWIERKGLKASDEINLEEFENSLIISSDVKGKKEATIEVSELNRKDITTLVTHLYRNGFDKIVIEKAPKEVQREIKSLDLLGFEITNTEKETCILENISEPSEDKYSSITNRILFVLEEAHKLVEEDLQSNKYQNKKELEELRKQQDRSILFCKRILSKEKHHKNILMEWEFLTFLTHIQHAYNYMYDYCAQNKIKINKQNASLVKDLEKYLEKFKIAYSEKDISLVHSINSEKSKYQFGLCLELIEKSKGKETVLLSYMREIFRLIQIATSPVIGIILDKDNQKSISSPGKRS